MAPRESSQKLHCLSNINVPLRGIGISTLPNHILATSFLAHLTKNCQKLPL